MRNKLLTSILALCALTILAQDAKFGWNTEKPQLLDAAAPPPPAPGQSLALLVDAINEKLFDAFGDTVVVFEDDRPQIPEEHHRQLRSLLGHD